MGDESPMDEGSFEDPFSSFPSEAGPSPGSVQEIDTIDGEIQQESTSSQAPNLAAKYQEIRKESKRLENEAAQLRAGLEIRRTMNECLSERLQSTNLNSQKKGLITFSTEAVWLHDGHLLLYECITNRSGYDLDGWTLIMTIRPLKYRAGSQSMPIGNLVKSVELGNLLDNEEFRTQLAIPLITESTPFIVETQLIRKFDLGDGDISAYRLLLDAILLSLWDTVSMLQHELRSNSELDKEINSSSILLPRALGYLLAGCPNENFNTGHIIRIVMPRRYTVEISIDQKEINFAVASTKNEKHFCKLSIFQASTKGPFTLRVACKDARVRSSLVSDLQARIILLSSSLKQSIVSKSIRELRHTNMIAEYDAICQEFVL